MWKNKLFGVLGLWIVALAFLGFSDSLHRVFLVLTGIAMIVFAFWDKKIVRPAKELEKEINQTSPENQQGSRPLSNLSSEASATGETMAGEADSGSNAI